MHPQDPDADSGECNVFDFPAFCVWTSGSFAAAFAATDFAPSLQTVSCEIVQIVDSVRTVT